MKVLNFGSLNVDYVYQLEHFVRPGETTSSDTLRVFCGGKGLNQSIAMARSGIEVYHAGAVGAADGGILLENLNKNGVDTTLVAQLECKSGHAIIQVNHEGENCIILYGGANQQITKAQVNDVLSRFDAGDYLVLQNEINELGYIMQTAHDRGLNVVLNPAPFHASVLALPLDTVDFFVVNEVEATDLCGAEAGAHLLDTLSQRYPKANILLTLGGKGSEFQAANGGERLRQGIYTVNAVDTTAAGDTFVGYFIAALIAGKSNAHALDLAAKAAAITVSSHGALPSIPTMEQVLASQLKLDITN